MSDNHPCPYCGHEINCQEIHLKAENAEVLFRCPSCKGKLHLYCDYEPTHALSDFSDDDYKWAAKYPTSSVTDLISKEAKL